MKKTLLGVIFALLTSTAFADLASYHEDAICGSEEVLSKMGNGGTCNIAVREKKTENRKGACFGKFDRNLNCLVIFLTEGNKSAVQLKCGAGEIDFAIFDKILPAESAYYNLSALIKTSEGRKIIMNDLNNHIYYSNELLLLYLVEDDKKEISGEVIINLEKNGVALQELQCTYF